MTAFLNDKQKLEIDKFVHGYLKDSGKKFHDNFGNPQSNLRYECYEALSDPTKADPKVLSKAKKILTLSEKRNYQLFCEVMKDPTYYGKFLIHPNNEDQIKAAKLYLQNAVEFYLERDEKDPVAYFDALEQKTLQEMDRPIIDTIRKHVKSEDPLTLDQKKSLFKFVGLYLEGFDKKCDDLYEKTLSKTKKKKIFPIDMNYGRKLSYKELRRIEQINEQVKKRLNVSKPEKTQMKKEPIGPICLKVLSKTDDKFNKELLKIGQAVIVQTLENATLIPKEQKNFTFFRQVVKDPTILAKELGLNPDKYDEIFAAQMFLKNAIQHHKDDDMDDNFERVASEYRKQLYANYSNKPSDVISAKNRLLMANDPVRKLDPQIEHPSSLDLVLANMHFESVPDVFKMVKTLDNGLDLDVTTTREEIRQRLASNMKKLWEDPLTNHIIEALGSIIKKEKLNIFVSGYLGNGTGEFRMNFTELNNHNFNVQGFATMHHSIYLSFPKMNEEKQYDQWNGVFIHESTHEILNIIVKFSCSPVKPGSRAEKRLDKALDKDMEHRKLIDFKKLTKNQQRVWGRMVTHLEESNHYFPENGFNSTKADHRSIRRAESIVRIMQSYAEGISLEDIKAVAPNLFDFYFKETKNLIENYCKSQ